MSGQRSRHMQAEAPITTSIEAPNTWTSAYMAHDIRIAEGSPFPLGATWDGEGVNFALFSANATKVELCLFDENGEKELERIELPEYTDEVFHVYLFGLKPGAAPPGCGCSVWVKEDCVVKASGSPWSLPSLAT